MNENLGSQLESNVSSLGENNFGKYLLNREDIYKKEELSKH